MKHLVDLDEDALSQAQRRLNTSTIKATVNAALRQVSGRSSEGADIESALDTLAALDLEDRTTSWR